MSENCPHTIVKQAGDETYTYCGLTQRPSGRIKPCLLESGDGCGIFNEYLQEVKDEANNIKC